jgi:type IV pilus assembly protein PilC
MKYKAEVFSEENRVVTLNEDHPSEESFRQSLTEKGYRLLTVKKRTPFTFGEKKVKKHIFLSELIRLLKSGRTLNACMEILSRHGRHKDISRDILRKLESGSRFSEAVKDSGIFSSSELAILTAGEESGRFYESVVMLNDYAAMRHDTMQKIGTMLAYPILLLILMVLVFGYVIFNVLPTLTTMYSDMGIELPSYAQIIISFVMYVAEHSVYILPFTSLGLILIIVFVRDNHEKILESLRVLPFIGKIIRQYMIFIFLRPFVLMLKQGIGAERIFEALKGLLTSWPRLHTFISQAEEETSAGKRLSDVLSKFYAFNEDIKEIIEISGESSELTETLEEIAGENDTNFENSIKQMMSLIEPAVILLIGLGVLFFVVTFVVPMMSVDIK